MDTRQAPGADLNMAKRKAGNGGATVGYDAKLWQMADALRGGMDAAEPFEEKTKRLTATLRKQMTEARKSDEAIVRIGQKGSPEVTFSRTGGLEDEQCAERHQQFRLG